MFPVNVHGNISRKNDAADETCSLNVARETAPIYLLKIKETIKSLRQER